MEAYSPHNYRIVIYLRVASTFIWRAMESCFRIYTLVTKTNYYCNLLCLSRQRFKTIFRTFLWHGESDIYLGLRLIRYTLTNFQICEC